MNIINYEELAQETKAKVESLPQEENVGHKEALSDVIRQKAQGFAPTYQPQPLPVAANPQAQPKTSDDLPMYAASTTPQVRGEVEQLIRLTLEKGLREGISEALKADPFVLDIYHDALTDKLMEEMKQRNII